MVLILINTKNGNNTNDSLGFILFRYFTITTGIPMTSCYVTATGPCLLRQHNLNDMFVAWNFQILNTTINIINYLSTPTAYFLTCILFA